jgi:MOSC domain-containing protein YiiM
MPVLSERSNVVVMADEAHRSQYAKFAENITIALPDATRIGFTGTRYRLQQAVIARRAPAAPSRRIPLRVPGRVAHLSRPGPRRQRRGPEDPAPPAHATVAVSGRPRSS